jgi:hypothetical protein
MRGCQLQKEGRRKKDREKRSRSPIAFIFFRTPGVTINENEKNLLTFHYRNARSLIETSSKECSVLWHMIR